MVSPLRILVVHNRYRTGQPSGEDRVVDQEIALLARAGHHVTTFERFSDDISAMGSAHRALIPLTVAWNPASRRDLAARLAVEQPDVVHVHNTFPLISPSILAACRDAGVPVVATLHNYLQVCPSGTLYRNGRVCTDCVGRLPAPAVRHGCYRGSSAATVPMAANLALNRARWWTGVRRFFCISNAQRQTLVQAGMPAQRLLVKHNFVVEPAVRRARPGEHVLYLGRLTAEKGVQLLMQAWDGVRAAGGVGMPLVLAGDGPLRDDVARWAEGRADVRYLGLRSPAECAELTAGAAAVVAPSTWPEAFGLVVVEAMAAAVPTVAAGHGALVELVDEPAAGLLHRPGDPIDLADCIQRIVKDVSRNMNLGAAARRRFESCFTAEKGLANLVSGYTSAMAGQNGEPV